MATARRQAIGDTEVGRFPRLALAVVLLGGTALVILYDWVGIGGSDLNFAVGGPLYDTVVIAAGVACLVRSRVVRRERWAWVLLGLAIVFWAAGEVYWTGFIFHDPSPPYPSPADIGYLALYPLAYAGLVLLVRARTHELDWRLWTDGLIAALGTAALGTAFIFEFVADQTAGTPLQVATSLAYPLGDIAMLAMIVGVIALAGWRPDRTWSLLLAGLGAQAVADIAYTLQSTNGVVPGGNWIDPIYLISAVFLGAIVWWPAEATIPPSRRIDDRRELMVPVLFAAMMIGLFAMQYFSATSGLSTALWAATMIAVVVRLAMSVRENKALLEQVRTDPLTGLGNRRRMQADLESHCGRTGEQAPVALFLFDLNGFKRYNDSFGHPAGDLLLTRLGKALGKAVGEDGIAYRVGGDEFCLLLTCEEERFDAVAGRAARALTASERGVEVSSSWGAVQIPREADTPSEALELADVRMYAQKESRRDARAGSVAADIAIAPADAPADAPAA